MVRFYSRFSRLISLATLAMLPLLLYGAKQAFDSNGNNVVDWLPQNFEETQRLFWFVERFGSDEILAIGWEGCTLDDERLDAVAAKLSAPVDDPELGADHRWFRAVYTGRQTLNDLTSDEPHLTREEALERMTGWLIGQDHHTTCLVGMISDASLEHRREALDFVRHVTADAGIPASELYIAGPTADSVAVDAASSEWIFELGLLSALVATFVAWLCLRNVRLVALVFIPAVVAWSLSLSLLYLSGSRMDAVMLVMPGLVFILAISGGLHLTNYYTSTLAEGITENAPAETMRRAWLPCSLAITTTVVGLASLTMSQLVPIRRFGIFASLGVLLDLVCLLLLWPALAQWWQPRTPQHAAASPTGRLEARLNTWWAPMHSTASRHGRLWIVALCLLAPVLGYGVSRLTTSVQLQDLFRSDAEIIRSCNWLERHLGALVPVEVVLRFPREEWEKETGMLQRALIVEELRQAIAQSPDFDSALAPTTFAPSLPKPEDGPQIVRRRILASRLPEYRDQFIGLRMLYDEPHEELWRISGRVSSAHVDYGVLLSRLGSQLDEFVQAKQDAGVEMSVEICGAVPLIYMAQQRLLQDLIGSYVVAFGVILLMMVFSLQNIGAAILAMIPNVFPALVAFGVMGLCGVPIDIGTMMTASVAMGVADDNTVHFLVWFRRGIQDGLSQHDAVRTAFEHCATPMMQTTAMCGLGMLVFVFSPFVPVARFGGVMAFMLAMGLFGTLVLLPSLVCSRVGRVLIPHHTHTSRPTVTLDRVETLVQQH